MPFLSIIPDSLGLINSMFCNRPMLTPGALLVPKEHQRDEQRNNSTRLSTMIRMGSITIETSTALRDKCPNGLVVRVLGFDSKGCEFQTPERQFLLGTRNEGRGMRDDDDDRGESWGDEELKRGR